MDFQRLAGLRNVSVDLNYDVVVLCVCLWYNHLSMEKSRLEFVLVGGTGFCNPT